MLLYIVLCLQIFTKNLKFQRFARRVHKLKVTLEDLTQKKILWDAIYQGSPDQITPPDKGLNGLQLSNKASYGSQYELSSDAPPSGGTIPHFRWICPPINNKLKLKLCIEDADETTKGWSECHEFSPGNLSGGDTINPDLAPKVPHTNKWDGMVPVKGLGYVAGGTFKANITAESGDIAKQQAIALNEQLQKGLVKVKTGRQSMIRFHKPRFPLYIGVSEDGDDKNLPTVGIDLFGNCESEDGASSNDIGKGETEKALKKMDKPTNQAA